jgi:oligoendopeptidase F
MLISRLALYVVVATALVVPAQAQERDRDKIPAQYKWDLTPLYPNDAAWRTDLAAVKTEITQLAQFKGKLGSSAASLVQALDRIFATTRRLSRLSTYAGLLADQDTRDAAHHAMEQEMSQVWSSFSSETSYVEPEILRIPPADLRAFRSRSPD